MNLPANKKIVLFDGHCNLCNGVVQFLLKNDKTDVFRFASLQSEIGIKILKHIGLDPKKTDSVVLYLPNIAYYIKSDAALQISENLGIAYQILRIFKIFPKKLRDFVYDYIARNRFKWFGRKDSCMIPSPTSLRKFL